jgi:hypothetical protein
MLRFNLLLELHLNTEETKASYFFNRYEKTHAFPSKKKCELCNILPELCNTSRDKEKHLYN